MGTLFLEPPLRTGLLVRGVRSTSILTELLGNEQQAVDELQVLAGHFLPVDVVLAVVVNLIYFAFFRVLQGIFLTRYNNIR